ncbi:MAG: hypothetical protein O6941_02415 [Planctomycetota bacterium]|nr:hypothetical protein [Planctomycetota bacterium]MCZ6852142.1 hypothetical protein [Planctomycetota bacterium]
MFVRPVGRSAKRARLVMDVDAVDQKNPRAEPGAIGRRLIAER